VADLDPWKRVAQLARMVGSSGGERRNAFAALERTMQSEGLTWTDIGNAIEGMADAVERAANGKYTENEMQEFALAMRKEGIEEGIKIGMVRGQAQQRSNGHTVLPEASEMAEYCHERLGRLKNDWQRDFIADIYAITRRRTHLSLSRLANLAKIYIEIGGRI
jgi:hypothetical protein